MASSSASIVYGLFVDRFALVKAGEARINLLPTLQALDLIRLRIRTGNLAGSSGALEGHASA